MKCLLTYDFLGLVTHGMGHLTIFAPNHLAATMHSLQNEFGNAWQLLGVF